MQNTGMDRKSDSNSSDLEDGYSSIPIIGHVADNSDDFKRLSSFSSNDQNNKKDHKIPHVRMFHILY